MSGGIENVLRETAVGEERVMHERMEFVSETHSSARGIETLIITWRIRGRACSYNCKWFIQERS